MEYGLLAALVAVAIIAAVTLAGKQIASTMNDVATHLVLGQPGRQGPD